MGKRRQLQFVCTLDKVIFIYTCFYNAVIVHFRVIYIQLTLAATLSGGQCLDTWGNHELSYSTVHLITGALDGWIDQWMEY